MFIYSIRTIAEESKLRSYSPTLILLDEWGTSGRKRATVSDLLNVLVKVELFRAADFIAENVLAETKPARPANGPSARYPIIDPEQLERQGIDSFLNQASYPNTTNLERSDNRSYMNNRKNSKSNDFDPVKSMGGIDMSTRDDNPPDTHDIPIEQYVNALHVQNNGRPNTEQSIATPHVESLTKDNLDFIANGSLNNANTADVEDSANISSGSCHDILTTPLSSMALTDDNQSSGFAPNNIPNLTELMPNS